MSVWSDAFTADAFQSRPETLRARRVVVVALVAVLVAVAVAVAVAGLILAIVWWRLWKFGS